VPQAVGVTVYVLMALVLLLAVLAVPAMSLNLPVGFTGLVSFGHAAFYGPGANVLVLVSPEYEAAWLWSRLPLAVLAAAAAALALGALSVRTAGIYVIMVTLAFGRSTARAGAWPSSRTCCASISGSDAQAGSSRTVSVKS